MRMEVKLDVLVSTSIKQRKPWTRITWIGQEKEAVFLLDDKHINEINLASGKTKKKIPQLQSLLKNVVVLTTSINGAWLAGLLTTGELFLWNKDQDCLKLIPAIEEARKVVAVAQECLMRLYLYVSEDGRRALLTTPTACVFLWESTEYENTLSYKNSSGRWTQILPSESVTLPSTEEKEVGVHATFLQNEVLGDCCLCSFVFYSGECLLLTFLILRWHENGFKYASSLPYQIHWVQQTCSLVNLVPQCVSIKSRGALLSAFARDGLFLAVAVNQIDPKATQILFLNTLNFLTVSGSVKGCSSKSSTIPSKFIRSYWVGDMSWTPDSLFLACMLKRGSLILLTGMGELLTLITSGCSVEFGPAEFIPIHPLITYRQHNSLCQDSSQTLGSSASESDLMRQRFSVASHSRLPYLIVSDGFMITVLRFHNNVSPVGFLRSLLLDSTQRLENIRRNVMNSQSKGRHLCLRSLLSLKDSLLKHTQNHTSFFFNVPKFLEEDTTETNQKTTDLLDYEDESDDEKLFHNSSSSLFSQRVHSFVDKADQGHIEFASMFDTIHAKDNTEEKDKLPAELNSVQRSLLTAWQIGISKNIEERDTFLNYTISCITHFFNILQFVECSSLNQDAFLNKSVKNSHWIHCVLKYFQLCLSVLHWHSRAGMTGHVAKLTLQTLKLMLVQKQDQLFSKNLLACFCLLKMVSHTLSSTCIPQYENLFASPGVNSLVELDSFIVPIFLFLDESATQGFSSLKSLLRELPQALNCDEKTEKRLIVLWRFLYKRVVSYWIQLNKNAYKNTEEETVVSLLLSHIQATLQSSGVLLEQHFKINSIAGEEKFLLGSYRESVDVWKKCLCEIKAKGGRRACFLQSRYYLAILFCHLYHYNLCEAQGLCDHLVGEILRRSQLSVSQMENFSDTKYSQHELWMITNVHTETAMAVIRSMARFMAAYFTNQLLYIFPPHSVDILHPLHIKPDVSPRIIPLQRHLVTRAVRDQNLSSVWTVEYALDLFFVGGLMPEAVWLTHRLGDWKLSVSIGVAYALYCQNSDEFTRLKITEHHLPLNLSPVQTFQEKLQSLLGQPATSETTTEEYIKYKQFTDPIEEEDADVLYSSVQELLKAAVMADADILSETFQLLIDSVKDLSRKFCGLIPDGLYLPAPPLYCPQPASLSEEDCNDIALKTERENRQKVSGVLQRIILLFRATCCSFPAAQWYISQLKWGRKIMQKIRMKGSLPSLSPFPETLLRYCNFHTAFWSESTSSGDHQLDDISCKILGWFRELCALCWMFHVRERLSDSCRRYQAARENANSHKDLKKNEYDASTVEHCLNAAEWACRMLPFCRFMNVEELIQDVILSLLGELPPVKKVAEIFVKAFPNPEDVRVPLKDKYHSLQQRFRHCTVQGPESEETMSVVIQAIEKARVKNLRLVIRNIGPIEINVWEPAEEGADYQEEHCYDNVSLGTSISRSTLTDLGNPQLHSEAETVDTLSDALLAEETRVQTPLPQREKEYQRQGEIGSKNATCKTRALSWKTEHMEKACRKDTQNQCNLPIVGAWEFERDDEEYVNFLELFLSYVLERDLVKYSDLRIPFLTSFSGLLRKHELNSLFFDIHTTLKRRQAKTRSRSVFRAGSCYTVTLTSYNPETASVHSVNQNVLENPNIVQSTVKTTEPSVHNSIKELKEGLFGLKRKSIYRAQSDSQGVTVASPSQTVPKDASCTLQTLETAKYVYKTTHFPDTVPGEELAIELTGKFSNIGRLLEWMIRWSDRRLLRGSKKQDSIDESLPMMHVKTSAAAVLTSLWLLEQLCKDGTQARSVTFKNPSNQCLKESTSLSEAQPRTKRECGVDEGTSANPPADVHNIQAYDYLCENSLGISTKSKYFDKKEIKHGNCYLPHVTEDLNKVEPFLQEELDITSESEEFFEEPFETPKSSNSSVRIKPGKDISSSAVDSPQGDQTVKKAKERKAEQNVVTEVATSTISQSFSLEQNSEVPSNIEISVSHGQPSLAAVSSISSVISSTSICAKKEDINKEVPTEEKLNTSETVRQMLQDEMFKLVQLQQINFMSLMQIVQSSFANLPNVQQTLQQYQSAHLEGIQPVPPAEGNGSGRPSCSAGASLKTQLPTGDNRGKYDQKSSDFQPTNSLRDEGNDVHIENHQNVSLSLLESHNRETGFMPSSQDLHSSAPVKPFHLLAPSSDVQKAPKFIPIEKNTNFSDGFPLLKLESGYHSKPAFLHPIEMSSAFARPPPIPRVAWNSSDSLWNHQSSYKERRSKSTAHLNMSRYKPEISRKMQEEEKRWAETVHKPPSKHRCSGQYEEREVSLEEQFSGNVKMDSTVTTSNVAGIPLLHLNLDPVSKLPPVIRQTISTALIPVKPVTKETDCRETLQHTGISLLHANLPQQKKVPKFIPPQDLIAFEQYCYHHTVASTSFGQDQTKPIQLLKTDLKPFEPRGVQNSTKRQKRRDRKQMKEELEKEKRSVSFCPDDSIINISDTVMAVEPKTDPETKCTSYLQDNSFISMDKAAEAVTTPDLHYMASTSKKIAETQDASTNTHPVPKSYKDIGISTEIEISDLGKNESDMSVPVSESSSVPKLSSPDMYLNLRFSSEVKERILPSTLSDVPDLSEHKYVSVTDIEDNDILNDLPMIPESADEIVTTEQNEKFEIPSTAELHHVAASVTNAIPSELLLKKDNHLKDVSSQKQKEHTETGSPRESVTWDIELEDARAFPSTRLMSKVIDKEYLSTKHQEIDMQLRMLQSITKNMEEDFRNTRQLVQIIEDLEMDANSDSHDPLSFSEDSRVMDDGFHLNGKLSESSVEDPLQITGLSDVTDIIRNLVTEGGISPMELGFPKTQAKKFSRYSQKTEKEKKEIRAWMKRKQKERMREYMKKVDEQRQKEHNPFNFKKYTHCRLTSKDIQLLKKKKEEKDKRLYAEHHRMRVSQALSLMNEMLSESVMLPASEHRPWSRARSPQECRKHHIVSTKGGHPNNRVTSERSRTAVRPRFGQKGHHFTPALGSAQSKAAEYRMSRVSEQKYPAVSTAFETEGFDHETGRDVESPWTVPDDIQRLLEDSHDTLFQDSAPLSFSPVVNHETDRISESTGSILSRLDWNAIEAMIADVEDT